MKTTISAIEIVNNIHNLSRNCWWCIRTFQYQSKLCRVRRVGGGKEYEFFRERRVLMDTASPSSLNIYNFILFVSNINALKLFIIFNTIQCPHTHFHHSSHVTQDLQVFRPVFTTMAYNIICFNQMYQQFRPCRRCCHTIRLWLSLLLKSQVYFSYENQESFPFHIFQLPIQRGSEFKILYHV